MLPNQNTALNTAIASIPTMYYLVLELETQCPLETPKDHTKISQIFYQVIDEKTLECQFAPVKNEGKSANSRQEYPSISVTNSQGHSLKEALKELTEKMHSILKNENTQENCTIDDTLIDSNFVVCSMFSTWYLKVTLPRQAIDENIQLPSYLKNLKIFDMWKEYSRWCSNHPEVITIDDNNINKEIRLKHLLSNLEIEFENNNDIATSSVKDQIKTRQNDSSNLPDPINSNDCEKNSPDRMETISKLANLFNINTTVEVIQQLHKKCDKDEDIDMVLTRPYDAKSDIDSFVKEHSRLLYLNNLPPDTTQSELESWFTQFGSRPVGFWMFKNVIEDSSNIINKCNFNNNPYVEEQDSISGFVIFQSHEKALEALTLSGHSILSNVANTKQPRVVEHIVELQPSSTRVLEIVQDSLVPFPQSKNKPRPGDWNCPSCGFSNFQRRTACFRCSFPIPSSAQKIHSNNNNNSNNNSHNNLIQNDISTSASNHNSNVDNNFSQYENISAFGQPMISKQRISNNGNNIGNSVNRYQNIPMNNNSNNNNNNNNHNFTNINGMNNNGSNIPFRAGDWKCAVCDYHNFAKNVICLRCSGPKTATVYLRNRDGNNNNYNSSASNININISNNNKNNNMSNNNDSTHAKFKNNYI